MNTLQEETWQERLARKCSQEEYDRFTAILETPEETEMPVSTAKKDQLSVKYGGKWTWHAKAMGGYWTCDDGKHVVRQMHAPFSHSASYLTRDSYGMFLNGEHIHDVEFTGGIA